MTAASQTQRTDVVIVGGGGAGLAAALEAASQGVDVVLLEKNPVLGGTTALAVGSVTASGTTLQRQAGIEDSTEDHFEDMGRFAGDLAPRDNSTLRRQYVERSGETMEWLRQHGPVFLGPLAEPPHRRARMHNVLPGSRAYVHHLSRAARRAGVQIRAGTQAVRPVVTDGRVTAIQCRGPAGEYRLEARRGVVLAAGDFSASTELKAQYLGALESTVNAVNQSSTGDGIRIGLEAGGRVVNGDLALGPELRFAKPPRRTWIERIPPYRLLALVMRAAAGAMPDALMRRVIMAFATTYLAPSPAVFQLGAVLVNGEGDRVVGEPGIDLAITLAKQPDDTGWIVLDRAAAERLNTPGQFVSTAPGIAYAYLTDYRRSRRDLYHRAETLPGLAQAIGVAPPRLAAAVSEANTRHATYPCQQPPFVALGPVRSRIVLTEGGLAVDDRCRVLGGDGRPIDGLFAAGSNGQGGLLLEGHGNHLGWAFISGRIAGRAAAAAPDHREGR